MCRLHDMVVGGARRRTREYIDRDKMGKYNECGQRWPLTLNTPVARVIVIVWLSRRHAGIQAQPAGSIRVAMLIRSGPSLLLSESVSQSSVSRSLSCKAA